jgi:regulator of protease activity HflC (stomatin/prohibitin superfamily)
MDLNVLKSNWALVAAAVIGVIIALIVLSQLIRRSAAGQLRKTAQELKRARKDEAKALKAVAKAERNARRLHEKADIVKPRHLQEAKDGLGDARALAKIANDKVLIAANHVRRVIFEEYPPRKQEMLRQKYLQAEEPDKRPFSF